jgi:flagellar biosynthetic protein FlhB
MADGNKTEKATQRRKNKAKEQGQIVRSRELSSILGFAAVAGVLVMMAPSAVTRWTSLYRNALYVASGEIEAGGPLLFWSSLEVLCWIVPIMLAGLVVSTLAGIAQGGLNFAPGALAPKFERFNPASKLGQIFSTVGLSQMLKSLLPFAVILWLTVLAVRGRWEEITHASSLGLRPYAGMVGSLVFSLTWKSALVMLVWSGVDYLLVWRKLESDLKMTKQEIREEYKETEGNPVIKGRVRQIQRAMRKRKSLKDAATATVVVTNPTHYAVALKYEMDMSAPIVVAKGRDLLAQKIKAIARENGIMTVENRPLAQALYKTVEVGDSIPGKLYQAVAEILAFVFRAQAEVRRQDAARSARNASGQRIGNVGATI